ncbi:MAG: glycosyl transferase, partial [Gemmatimonadota bacterium]|nr:glycosyl transferase [Gemmatimonadota bacterium]
SVTVYAEAVLNDPVADVGHPAFSKLFVQTEAAADGLGLIAWRRLRSVSDEPLFVVAKLVGAGEAAGVESDRAQFIGRGRSLATPRAMMPHVTLSGSAGNVLDPVLAIRRTVMIPPGQSETLLWLIGAGADRAEAES